MNFEAAAAEVFQILRSYNYEVLLFDEEHNQVFEPAESRRFFAKPVNLLVSIIDDGEDSSVRLYLSKSTGVKKVLGLISALRMMATKYKMIFNVREYDKNLAPKDFATQAAVAESKEFSMNLVEGMYGTSRSSYLKLENARMIVRHSTRINENILGARGRNVETIHIEDGVGQRFLMPTPQLAPARAMAHHVDNGGSWADPVGEQITRMAQDFADLGAASRHIGHYAPELTESAVAMRETIREAARGMRKTFEGFGRKTRYADVCEAVTKLAETLNENTEDAYRDKITELASMLNTNEVELSERVLTTVARTLESAVPAAAPAPTVSVLGRPVNAETWAGFKQGKMNLTGTVNASAQDPGNAALALRRIVAVTGDDTLANLLAFVSEQLARPIEQREADTNALKMIAATAMKAAGMSSRNPNDPAATPAVREFLEWAREHSVQRLMEMDRFNQPTDRGQGGRGILDRALRDFDFNEFITSPAASEFNFDILAQLDDEEKTFTKEEVLTALDAFLQRKVRDVGHGVETISDAKFLLPHVIEYMMDDGYHIIRARRPPPQTKFQAAPGFEESVEEEAEVEEDACMADRDFLTLDDQIEENCGMCDGDGDQTMADRVEEDLTAEDVLLPKSQGDDLVGEVTKATVLDPDSGEERAPDDAYLNRLQSLAGMK